jgi:acyl carrier protein
MAGDLLRGVADAIRAVLRDPDVEVAPADVLDDLPGWDSIDLVALVVEAECRFGVVFGPEEVERLGTVGDLIRAIEAKRAPIPAAADSGATHRHDGLRPVRRRKGQSVGRLV